VIAEICSVIAVVDSVVPDRVVGAANEGLIEDVLEILSSHKLTIYLELILLIFSPVLFSSGFPPSYVISSFFRLLNLPLSLVSSSSRLGGKKPSFALLYRRI
jgi:hypothetical protein